MKNFLEKLSLDLLIMGVILTALAVVAIFAQAWWLVESLALNGGCMSLLSVVVGVGSKHIDKIYRRNKKR